MQPSWGISAPDCVQVPWSRENHLGNGVSGFTNSYNMTIPSDPCADNNTCVCVLRMRYNISSVEDGYPTMSNPDANFVDWTYNDAKAPIKQNPVVFMGNGTSNVSQDLQLAVDTTQFGRTFQDRSFTFVIAKRPSGILSTARIYNLNVRGKRGNIVQAYPATEYDFVPSYLYTRVGDYIHFQWTGCDTNPSGNAGEGMDGTDRSNFAQISRPDSSVPVTDQWCSSNPKLTLFTDPALRLRFATLDQVGCVNYTTLEAEDNGATNADEDERNCAVMNTNGSNYFNGGLIRMNKTGTFNYMSTRNHAFTNRDQKGIIYVVPLLPGWAIGIVVTGSVLFVGAAVVAGMMFYAKSRPHSAIANLFSKF